MATLATTPTCPPLTAVPPTSAQPGGGFCMGLELAWGRLRRGFLRRFRPGYVRRMAGLRRGDCPGCPHDIIDSRDLKFFRNVCGYSFRPGDDPFAYRDRLGFARYGLTELFFFTGLFLGTAALFGALGHWLHGAFYFPMAAALVAWLEIPWFFRDPERAPPDDPDALVSPADGTVTHVGEVEEPEFPGGRAFRVSVFLSVFNVHVNRAPRAARVAAVRYFPGEFLDARRPDCGIRNEQLWMDFVETHHGRELPIRVKQISGAIARRIVCWLKPGDQLRAGERVGMIKFGSRTDLLLPVGVAHEVKVRVGDKVRGGSTVLLRLAP